MKSKKIRYLKNKIFQIFEHPFRDLYHWLLVITWWQFLLLLSLFYFLVNVAFACAYLTTNGGIANARSNSFIDAFFFSVQSLSTIGYGAMYPQTLYAQILVTFEVLVGLILVAMATGLMFARFAQPNLYKTHDILWSMRFVDILQKSNKGEYTINYEKFHDVTPI